VVGVDGSPASVAAVRWALLHAAHERAAVELISCWRTPSTTEVTGVQCGAGSGQLDRGIRTCARLHAR
jgi:hypothetical protein